MNRIITGSVKALVSQYAQLDKNGMPLSVSTLSFFQESSVKGMMEMGYTVIGEAEISATIFPPKKIIESKVEALRAESKKIRAESTIKETRIEQQIRGLLAIGFDGNMNSQIDDIPF